MTKGEKIAKLGKEITDRATVLLGKDKITPESPEYLGINSALKYTAYKYDQKMADDILDICLTMKKRVPLTIEQLAKKNPQFDRAYLEKAMQAVSESGLVEFHWENLDGKNPNHEKRWVLDMFVPGSAEIMMINPEQSDMYPETADFFERMAYLPLAGITEMVPPGGAGIGMHVIPVEKAIPAESKSLPIEHLSHWLKKYEGHIGVSVCSCRKQQRIRGEGSGDVEGEWCIGVGDFADYCRETNHGRDITYEEAMEIPMKADDNGLNLYTLQCKNHILKPLHEHYGIDVSDKAIRQAVAEHNRVCELIRAIGDFRKGDKPRITGYEFHVITLATYVAPKYLIIDKLEETLEELKTREPDEKGYRARVLVVGSEVDDCGFIKLVEDTGAYVCADRFCYGSLPGRDPIELTDDEDALTQICRQYMYRGQCPRYMNTAKMTGRREYVNKLAKEYGADGIIYEQIKFCDPWAYERMMGSHIMHDDYGYPVLSVDCPYNISSSGQMRTRVQAFVESIEIKKIQGGDK